MRQPANARRYAFDTEFDVSGAIVRQGARQTSYSAEELEQQCAAAYAAGRNDEVARAQAQIAQTVAAIAKATGDLTQAFAAERHAMLQDAAVLAHAAAKKIAGAALDSFGIEKVRHALEEAFASILGAPRIIVRLAPALDDARALLEQTARDNGFDGALVVRLDPALQAGDVTLDWGEGAVVHDRSEALARIEDHLNRALALDVQNGAQA